MNLTTTNQIWLEKVASKYNVPAEALLSLILDRLRQQDREPGEYLIEWIDAPAKAQELTAKLLEEIQKVGSNAEGAAKAAQLYLSLIQSNKI